MTIGDYQFRTELIGRPFRGGEAKGKAEGVLDVLEARGFSVPDRVRERVAEESDPEILSGWLRRAATVERVGTLFD